MKPPAAHRWPGCPAGAELPDYAEPRQCRGSRLPCSKKDISQMSNKSNETKQRPAFCSQGCLFRLQSCWALSLSVRNRASGWLSGLRPPLLPPLPEIPAWMITVGQRAWFHMPVTRSCAPSHASRSGRALSPALSYYV